MRQNGKEIKVSPGVHSAVHDHNSIHISVHSDKVVLNDRLLVAAMITAWF